MGLTNRLLHWAAPVTFAVIVLANVSAAAWYVRLASVRPAPTLSPQLPEPPEPQTSPRPTVTPTPISGDVAVLLVVTDDVNDRDAELAAELEAVRERLKGRLLDGQLYTVDREGEALWRRADDGRHFPRDRAIAADDFAGAFDAAFAAADRLAARATARTVAVHLLWTSFRSPDEGNREKTVKVPTKRPLALYWLSGDRSQKNRLEFWFREEAKQRFLVFEKGPHGLAESIAENTPPRE